MSIPKLWRRYAITINCFTEIFFMLASIVTPISVGRGEAIRNPAKTGKICL
jgi:hypothetical protein